LYKKQSLRRKSSGYKDYNHTIYHYKEIRNPYKKIKTAYTKEKKA